MNYYNDFFKITFFPETKIKGKSSGIEEGTYNYFSNFLNRTNVGIGNRGFSTSREVSFNYLDDFFDGV
jgi:hypothetical protein